MTRARDLAAFVSNADGDIKFDTDTLFIDSSTNRVGIGTDSPQTDLHIKETGGLARIRLEGTASAADNFEFGQGTTGVVNSGFEIRDVDAAATRLVIDTNGKVGIGTSSPNSPLEVSNGTENQRIDFASGLVYLMARNASSYITQEYVANIHKFTGYGDNGSNEAMRIDDAGRVMIGTTTEGAANEAEDLTIASTGQVGITIRSTDSGGGRIYFSDGTSGTPEYAGYQIYNHSSNEMIFGTNAVERMRISGNQILIGTTSAVGSSNAGLELSGNDGNNFLRTSTTATTGYDQYVFINGNGVVGRITTSGSGTTYGSGSDYRLKENVVDISDGITRVKQLSPRRFNFIADADTTVDGFLAHEAATVVPEAVTGTKDGVEVWKEHEELPDGVSVGDNKLDDDGNTIPDYQGIDQSKLVPLLTAALQEAIAKIETLETKVAALEA